MYYYVLACTTVCYYCILACTTARYCILLGTSVYYCALLCTTAYDCVHMLIDPASGVRPSARLCIHLRQIMCVCTQTTVEVVAPEVVDQADRRDRVLLESSVYLPAGHALHMHMTLTCAFMWQALKNTNENAECVCGSACFAARRVYWCIGPRHLRCHHLGY